MDDVVPDVGDDIIHCSRAYHRGVRTAALALVLCLLLLTGCTWSDSEPGLFRERADTASSAPPAPEPTNPRLPVAGEATWTSAEGQQVTARIAVHAVRRTATMTVLDWSITPLSAPDRQIGGPVPPGFDLGLDRTQAGGVNIVLLDPRAGSVYRPLSSTDRQQGYRCLCTPLWTAQTTLRIGTTRLLQLAFPPLPPTTRYVDVVAATLPPFGHVPVSAEGTVPTATHPAELSRPADPTEPLTPPQYFRTGEAADGRRSASLRVDQVLVGADSTTIRWTLRSTAAQRTFLVVPLGLPLVAPAPPDAPVVSTNAASGPTVAARGGRPRSARWMTGDYAGRPFLECLCTNLDFWAIGLREAGAAAQLVTTYPPLPRGTDRVDIALPGVANLTGLPVTPATDGATRVGPATAASVGGWTYDPRRPPAGWSTDEWPTPLPLVDQIRQYDQHVDAVVTLSR